VRTCDSDKCFGLIDVNCMGNAAVMESLTRCSHADRSSSLSGFTVIRCVILFAGLGMSELKVLTVDGHPAVIRCSEMIALFRLLLLRNRCRFLSAF
jgi:hypothetical protein